MKAPQPRGPSAQILLALWAAALVLFNFPMLIVWDRDVTVLGLPLLPVAPQRRARQAGRHRP